MKEQDRQCAHNVTLRRVRATIVALESSMYYICWVCVYSLSYPACSALASYCHLWPVRLYSIFPHYLTNSTIFEKKKLLDIKCGFLYSFYMKH